MLPSFPLMHSSGPLLLQRMLVLLPESMNSISEADSLMDRNQFTQTGMQIQQGQIYGRPSVRKQEEAHMLQRFSVGEDERAFCRLMARILLRTLQETSPDRLEDTERSEEVGAGMRAGQGDVPRRESTETLARPVATDLSGREGSHRLPFQLPGQRGEK